MIDPTSLTSCLASFLRIVPNFVRDTRAVRWHLGFPSGSTTFIGSQQGRLAWDSDEGRSLVRYLLNDSQIRDWYSPDERLGRNDLYSVIAGAVDKWLMSGTRPSELAESHSNDLLSALRNPEIKCTGASLAHGLSIGEHLELPCGMAASPLPSGELANLLSILPLTEKDLIRIPSGESVLLISSVSASRAESGRSALALARGMTRVNLQRLRLAIWLACGTWGEVGDTFVWQESQYPGFGTERIQMSPEQRYAGAPKSGMTVGIVAEHLTEIAKRLAVVWGITDAGLDTETEFALRNVYRHIEPCVMSPDSMLTLLMSYSAIDGLLLDTRDASSRLGPRVARLIGRSEDERRSLRKSMTGLRSLRNNVAHGRIPTPKLMSAVIDIPAAGVVRQDLRSWEGYETNNLLRQHCLDLLRRVMVSMLWLSVDTGSGSTDSSTTGIVSGLTRKEILQLLDAAQRDDATSQLELSKRLPQILNNQRHMAPEH